jgi:hypothetical protein
MRQKLALIVGLVIVLAGSSSAQHDVTFLLVNKTGFEFVDIYVSPTGQDKWGEDLSLGVFTDLEAKDFKIASTEEVCQYDLKAIRPDSTELLFKGVNLCKKLIVTLLYEFDQPVFVQDIIVENLTDYAFSEIYIRDSPVSFWGQNVLGANILTRNEKAVISIPPGNPKACLYDIKAVLMNGQELLFKNINICNQAHIVLMRYQGKPYHGFE